jgi:hypothetical protein
VYQLLQKTPYDELPSNLQQNPHVLNQHTKYFTEPVPNLDREMYMRLLQSEYADKVRKNPNAYPLLNEEEQDEYARGFHGEKFYSLPTELQQNPAFLLRMLKTGEGHKDNELDQSYFYALREHPDAIREVVLGMGLHLPKEVRYVADETFTTFSDEELFEAINDGRIPLKGETYQLGNLAKERPRFALMLWKVGELRRWDAERVIQDPEMRFEALRAGLLDPQGFMYGNNNPVDQSYVIKMLKERLAPLDEYYTRIVNTPEITMELLEAGILDPRTYAGEMMINVLPQEKRRELILKGVLPITDHLFSSYSARSDPELHQFTQAKQEEFAIHPDKGIAAYINKDVPWSLLGDYKYNDVNALEVAAARRDFYWDSEEAYEKVTPQVRMLSKFKNAEDGFTPPAHLELQMMRGPFMQKLRQVRSLQNQLAEPGANKAKLNNQIGKLQMEMRSMRAYKELARVLGSDEAVWQLDDESAVSLLRKPSEQLPMLRSKNTDTWSGDQSFTSERSDKVIAIYPSRQLVAQMAGDPVLSMVGKHFLKNKGHFFDGSQPIGWALVNPVSSDTWVVNQIQSDFVSNFRNMIREAEENINDSAEEELMEVFDENNRAGWAYQMMQRFPDLWQAMVSDRLETTVIEDYIKDKLPYAPTSRAARMILTQQPEIENALRSIAKSLTYKQKLENASFDQLKHIKEKLAWLIDGWHKLVFQNVWEQAMQQGVKHLYWNTPNTVDSDANQAKLNHLYQAVPKDLGFSKKRDKLRDTPIKDSEDGTEEFWYREASRTPRFARHCTIPDGLL